MLSVYAQPRRRAIMPQPPMDGCLFRQARIPSGGIGRPPAGELFQRFVGVEAPQAVRDALLRLERGETGNDIQQVVADFRQTLVHLNRGITTGTSAFPVRENLEAEAKSLIPEETPLRTRLSRVPGAGLASAWKQLTTMGGGWGSSYDQPGGGSTAQLFYAESGAPGTRTSTYADRSAAYKLMGFMGSVTLFAMAAGANFMRQYATEKVNAIRNLLLNEEFALINADSTSTSTPWGDGTNALAYDGLLNLIKTGNGTPSANIQTGVGPLTLAHIDSQLTAIWKQGGRGLYILCNVVEAQSITNLCTAAGNAQKFIMSQGDGAGKTVAGNFVTHYIHPATGELVEIIRHRFMPQGTLIFGSDRGPNGDPAFDVDVLPQVELPMLAAGETIQGYSARELAPTTDEPDVMPFLVSVYSVPRLKIGTVFGKSSGLTAV